MTPGSLVRIAGRPKIGRLVETFTAGNGETRATVDFAEAAGTLPVLSNVALNELEPA